MGSNAASGFILVLGIVSVAMIGFIILLEFFLLQQKKWAFYTLVVLYILSFIGNLSNVFSSSGDGSSIISLLTSVIVPIVVMISVFGGYGTVSGKNPFA